MEADLASGPIGTVGKYDVEFKDGKLMVEVSAGLPMGTATLMIEVGAEHVLDALAKAIPGSIDDAVISVIKAALLAK